MGTLTANQERLPGMCAHKLPTSCRLSSIPNCCACADDRAHTAAYSLYVDGLGYVPRGTRWHQYCWFCKEFWENRVQASGLRSAQTRIPETPNQDAFLARWYEFHQGFRVVLKDDGTEERVAVLGEDFRDVSPGILPRTLEELRAGRLRSEAEDREREAARQLLADASQQPVVDGPDIEDELDRLLEESDEDDDAAPMGELSSDAVVETATTPQTGDAAVPSGNPSADDSRNIEYRFRRVSALRHELRRMLSGIERVSTSLRELGVALPSSTGLETSHMEAVSSVSRAITSVATASATAIVSQSRREHDTSVASATQGSETTSIQARIEQAQQQVDSVRRARGIAAASLETVVRELRAAEARLRQLHVEQRTTENYVRLFGTREEMLAQGENYQSPISGMFERADERFERAEEIRREERILRRVLEDQAARGDYIEDETLERIAELGAREQDIWSVPRAQAAVPALEPTRSAVPTTIARTRTETLRPNAQLTSDEVALEGYYTLLRRQNWSQRPPATGDPLISPTPREVADAATTEASIQPETILTQQSTSAHRTIVGGPPGHQLDDDPSVNNDRGLDAAFVLSALSASDELRHLVRHYSGVEFLSSLRNRLDTNALTWIDGENIENLLENEDLVWRSRLPEERNRRRRARGEEVTFVPDILEASILTRPSIYHLEIMAECFQMSARVRQVSRLNAPDQQSMLNRLQRGLRDAADRETLSRMLDDNATLGLAIELHQQQTGGRYRGDDIHARIEVLRQRLLDRQRMASARFGNHSRQELNAQRQAAQAVGTVAMAASRLAMSAGPEALFERIASRSAENRAAYERMREMQNDQTGTNIFITRRATLDGFTASPWGTDSEGDEEHDELRGLDARDTGRPDEPLAEEEMSVKLDCRICYSQISTIACLPCGHLSMCQWCSDQHSPTTAHDKTRLRRAAACPVCRKGIKQKVKIIPA